MCALATDRQKTTVRLCTFKDLRGLLRLIDSSWRVHLRVSPVELQHKLESSSCLVAEDAVGIRGFMMIEATQSDSALIVAAGLRDTWSVRPYLQLLLPSIEQIGKEKGFNSLQHIGNAPWLTNELRSRGFDVRERMIAFERLGETLPPKPESDFAQLRSAHVSDLSVLMRLDKLAFEGVWHKTRGHFNQALAKAVSFSVAIVNSQIVAYEWTDLYRQHAHLTRLAVHPDFQGQGIGGQLLYQAIDDALDAGADLITLNTQENNQRSRALYQRFGFVDTGLRLLVLSKVLK